MIQTKVLNKGEWSPVAKLEPFVHAALYKLPQIQTAIAFLADNVEAELVAVRVSLETDIQRLYTIAVVTQPGVVDDKYLFEFETNE